MGPTTRTTPRPDVSVVIPVYNSAPWLEQCLVSVLTQPKVTLEVICIDDGSDDGSSAILARFARHDARVNVIAQSNSGQSVARNRGLAHADGRYLVYLDSDDYWAAGDLARLIERADSDNLDILLFDGVAFRDGAVSAKTWDWYAAYYPRSKVHRGVRTGADLAARMRRAGDYRPHVGLYLARTDFVRRSEVRFLPGIVHQDNPYTFALLLLAERAAHDPIALYARRVRPGSTITTLSPLRSADGYFRSFLEMTRVNESARYSRRSARAVYEIVLGVRSSAIKRLAELSRAELRSLVAPDDSIGIQSLLVEMWEEGRHPPKPRVLALLRRMAPNRRSAHS